MAGLGGAYISLVRVPQWTDGITAGAGWIALAIVVFASWRPWRVLLGAYLFGGITVLQLNLQVAGARDPGRVLVDGALSDNHPRAGHHVLGPRPGRAERACRAGPELPRLALRPTIKPGRKPCTNGETTNETQNASGHRRASALA